MVRSLAAAGPAAGLVGVLWARVSDAEQTPPALLDATERARWAAYRQPVDRQRFLLGVLMTRLVVAELVGCRPEQLVLDRTCGLCGRPHGPVLLVDLEGPPGHVACLAVFMPGRPRVEEANATSAVALLLAGHPGMG